MPGEPRRLHRVRLANPQRKWRSLGVCGVSTAYLLFFFFVRRASAVASPASGTGASWVLSGQWSRRVGVADGKAPRHDPIKRNELEVILFHWVHTIRKWFLIPRPTKLFFQLTDFILAQDLFLYWVILYCLELKVYFTVIRVYKHIHAQTTYYEDFGTSSRHRVRTLYLKWAGLSIMHPTVKCGTWLLIPAWDTCLGIPACTMHQSHHM